MLVIVHGFKGSGFRGSRFWVKVTLNDEL